MIKKEIPKERLELGLVNVAAWTWYEQSTLSKSDSTRRESRDVNLEAIKKREKNLEMLTRSFEKPTMRMDCVNSSLLDGYEIARISQDLDYYIHSSYESHRNSIDGIRGYGARRIVPLMERDTNSGRNPKRASKPKKWFRLMHEVCGLNKGDVVENVGFRMRCRQVAEKHKSLMDGVVDNSDRKTMDLDEPNQI